MAQDVATYTNNQDIGDEYIPNQYVTFQVANEGFGFPMSSVLEIIRVPDTVDVPLTPHSLVGLANLRGKVLPILDLRTLLQRPKAEHNEATRVVVADVGTSVGLVVDSITSVLEIADDCIEQAQQLSSTISDTTSAGVIKDKDGQSLTQLLDVDALISQEFAEVIEQARQMEKQVGGQEGRSTGEASNKEDETSQLVSFVVDGQEYAIDLMDMQEIVRVPDEVTRVPASESHVLGMINLRGRVLPLVSLRQMLGLDEKAVNEHNRVLVIGLQKPGGQLDQIGMVVDTVNEVLRVSPDTTDEVPALLGGGDENTEITAICRLDDGKRLISILSADQLFQNPAIQEAMETQGSKEDIMGSDIQVESDDDGTTAQMIVFNLNNQEYGVMLEQVQEITRVPENINEVPKTADFIEGMVNLRGKVMPVLDMRTRLGMESMERDDKQRVLVLDVDGIQQGFITDAVIEVLQISTSQIEASPNLSDDQSRVMGEVVNLKESKRMIQLLKVKELLGAQEQEQLAELVADPA